MLLQSSKAAVDVEISCCCEFVN